MNQLQIAFDYAQLDNSTADFLRQKERNIKEFISTAYYQVGKELKEAQDRLSNHHGGEFQQWYESLGFKKRTVYNLIDYHNLVVQQLHNRETIESLPKRLAYEIAKPSADPELKQQVLEGDIKSHKEYKQLEQEKKALEEKLAKQAEIKLELYEQISTVWTLEETIKTLESQVKMLENREPETVEIEREVIPPDYQQIKSELEKSKKKLKDKNKAVENLQARLADVCNSEIKINTQRIVDRTKNLTMEYGKKIEEIEFTINEKDVDYARVNEVMQRFLQTLDNARERVKKIIQKCEGSDYIDVG